MFVGDPLHQSRTGRRGCREGVVVVHEDRHLALSLEEGRAVESLVFERKAESVDDLRDGRVARPAHVVVVDDLVIVQVAVFHVARADGVGRGVDVLRGRGGDLFLSLKSPSAIRHWIELIGCPALYW